METIRDFEKTGLYEGFAENQRGKKYPGRNPQSLSLAEAAQYESFSGMMKDNVVLMDADEQPHSDILKKIIEGEKLGAYVTDRSGGRGIHALMFNGNTSLKKADKVMLACGVVVDFHPGYSLPGECLKFNGIERKPVYDAYPYQNIPKYFMPLPKCNIDFTNLGEGDGRNSALFNYILTLQSHGFSKEEIKSTIRVVNKYVLAEPVGQDELETILRDEAFKKQSFFVKNKFRHDLFAKYIKSEYHVKKINRKLHIYHEGIYVPDLDIIEHALIEEISTLKDSQRTEVMKYLKIICTKEPDQNNLNNLNYIAFKNGLYDIKSDKLIDFSPDIVITNQIPWDYNPNAESTLLNEFLGRLSCGDDEIKRSLCEVAGACLYRSATVGGGRCAILLGNKQNGKSTYLHVLEEMLGGDNVSDLDMCSVGDRFNKALVLGKLANLGDDISSDYIADTAILKKMITGERIEAEWKGKDGFKFTPYAMHIYCANDIPRMKDPTGAMQRRLLIIPLNGTFTKDSPGYDPDMQYKLKQPEVMEYFILLALEGLRNVLKNKTFSEPTKVKAALKEYEKENNPVLSFIEDVGEDAILNEPVTDVFKRYQVFCVDSGFVPDSKITFSKKINSHLGTESKPKKINGKNIRIYIRKEQISNT